jgi:Sulfatase
LTLQSGTQPDDAGVLRDFAVCLSLANLCYLRVWSELLTYRAEDAFLMKGPPSPFEYAAAALNTLLLSAGFWLVLRWMRTKPAGRWSQAAEWAFLLVLLLPLNALRHVASNQSEELFRYLRSPLIGLLTGKTALVFAVAVMTVTVPVVALTRRRIVRAASFALLLLFPFVPLVFVQGAWTALRYDPSAFAGKPLATRLAGRVGSTPRVLWILFDEWDQRLTFEDRDPRVRLPEVDHFRLSSIYVPKAWPPSSRTLCSIPALTTGRPVAEAKVLNAGDLLLKFADGTPSGQWGREPDVFSDARAIGVNTAVVGWYLPYCRALGDELTACWWWEMSLQHNSMGEGLSEILPNQALSLFETSQFAPWGQSRATLTHAQTVREVLSRAVEEASDRRHDLVFMHIPIPHGPHVYDRRTRQFTLSNSPVAGYWDSLELLDKALFELRRAMERSGVWDSTTILLSSDHCNRSSRGLDGKEDHRVPFLLKIAGQNSGLVVPEQIQTVLSRDLVRAILRRDIVTAAEAVAWIGERGRCQLKNVPPAAEVVRREAL